MLIIKKAKREDARAMWTIRNEAIVNQCVGHYPMDALKTWTSGELSETFIEAVEQYFYVAAYNDQVVGTGMINLETEKIDAVFVHPNHMRKGIGKEIVKFLEDIALSHRLQTLTLESTLNAAAFYRACGFGGNEVGTYISPRVYHSIVFQWLKFYRPTTASSRRRCLRAAAAEASVTRDEMKTLLALIFALVATSVFVTADTQQFPQAKFSSVDQKVGAKGHDGI